MTPTKAQQVAALFYHHCGHAGVLRPEVFSTTALPEQFTYVYAPQVSYELLAETLLIRGQMLLALPHGAPLWLLFHLYGPQGEIMSWVNLQRLDPDTYQIVPWAMYGVHIANSSHLCLVRLKDADISKYAFVLRRYQQQAWATYEKNVAGLFNNVVLREEESYAPVLSDRDFIPPVGWPRSGNLGDRMRSRTPLASS